MVPVLHGVINWFGCAAWWSSSGPGDRVRTSAQDRKARLRVRQQDDSKTGGQIFTNLGRWMEFKKKSAARQHKRDFQEKNG